MITQFVLVIFDCNDLQKVKQDFSINEVISEMRKQRMAIVQSLVSTD